MAANNPWEMSWKEDTTVTKSEQGSSPWTMNWQEEKAKPTKKLSAIEQIRTGNFPAAERFRAGYAQMPEYLQDPYLGLSTSNIGKVGAEMFPRVTKFISQTIPEKLMQSALKPTQKQLESGKAATAVKTMLEEGINPTQIGVKKLENKITDINNQIVNKIGSSTGTVSKTDVLKYLDDIETKKLKQVNPSDDIAAINKVRQEFMAYNQPIIKTTSQTIPVQLAQELKQGTYSALKKKYGQLGSTEVEAQKTLARGLKEKIGEAVPEVIGLNKKESELIDTLDVVERRALMELNKNPAGLALLTESPQQFAAFMADKSALFKSLLARGLYNFNKVSQPVQGLLNTPQAARATSILSPYIEE
jgi:predicted house-cleaning noncanonical NTP pyrophosphatase (MazG superfamily)